ncbi:MAG: GC-type dockerin domain-anchored protein, partial [Phycisphaerales bacterium]
SYQILPMLPGHNYAEAHGITNDGTRIVGVSGFGAAARAFLWNPSSPATSLDLGVVSGQPSSSAHAISVDGGTVVGESGTVAFRWTAAGGMQSLGSLPGQTSASAYAQAVSGSVIVGTWRQNGNDRGFMWAQSMGMVDLGMPANASAFRVRGISHDDGACVVGQAFMNSTFKGVVRTRRNGVQDIVQHLQNRGVNMTGWTITDCTAVNPNGTAFAGIGLYNGQSVGWVVRDLGMTTLISGVNTETVCQNGVTTISTGGPGTVSGVGLQLQWYKNGVELVEGVQSTGSTITGTTTTEITISGITPADAGAYSMEASVQGANPKMSAPQQIYVTNASPSIWSQPVDTTGCPGSSISLGVGANSGAGNVLYRWQRRVNPFPNVYEDLFDGPTANGSSLSGTNTATLTINTAQLADSNRYRCIVTNTVCGALTGISTNRVFVTVNAAPVITSHPTSTFGCVHPFAIAQFSVASSSPGVVYQWQKRVPPFFNLYVDIFDGPNGNGGSYFGTNTPNFSVLSLNPPDFTEYRCVFTDACGIAVSLSAELWPVDPFDIAQQPQDAVVCQGGNPTLTFTLTSGNIGFPTFQWYKVPGVPITDGVQASGSIVSGAQSISLQFTGFQAQDAGQYYCVVNGYCGLPTTANATLTFCPGDYNCDGSIDGDDVIWFFTLWDAGDPAADTNLDNSVDGDDVISFFEHWDQGC